MKLTELFHSNPALYRPFNQFTNVLGKGPGSLHPLKRAWVAAYVSYLNECKVCFTGHSLNSRAGFEKEVEDALADPKLAPIVRLARKITLDHNRVTEEDRQAMLSAGWDTRALQDTVMLIAYMNMMNRLVHGLGIDEMGRKRNKPSNADGSW